ncbi:hypothetical protein GMLC_05900 [Geomonas limicola]|uniref:Uncharacterized protein n=1 Tax=Geomonas limicola TaxID=2740186 RepID=A0A6V8N3I7_9BACT|nr:hypothetical protein [Geomonas limicola]GFO67011.1 hypothetical protein GMLC_05900 [Geomonas limicola]
MQNDKKPISPLRRPFVAAGALVGVALSIWYLVLNVKRTTLVPDPIWTRFVNVALIMFVSIYLANLLRRLVEALLKRKTQR